MKGNTWKTVVRAVMVYGLETVALKKRQRKVAEIKMLRFSLGVTRMDEVRTSERRCMLAVGGLL